MVRTCEDRKHVAVVDLRKGLWIPYKQVENGVVVEVYFTSEGLGPMTIYCQCEMEKRSS
jgi:hypothetical protein